MSQFDKVYKELVETVLNKGTMSTGKVRTKYADGTPAHYISYIGYQFRLDNSTDEAHLITSRYAPYKSAIREIYWIWKLRSNNVEELEKLGCHFWSHWGIRKTSEELTFVQPRVVEKRNPIKPVKVNNLVDVSLTKFKSKSHGFFYILDRFKDSNGRKLYKIQFENTGSIDIFTKNAVMHRDVRDKYSRTEVGVGYYGDHKAPDIVEYFGSNLNRWVDIWRGILKRTCIHYRENKPTLIAYYSGVILDSRFESCEYFLRWVMQNNRYSRDELNVLQVDKDYYASNCYGPDTCVVVTPQENALLTLPTWYLYNGRLIGSRRALCQFLHHELRIPELIKFYNNQKNVADYYRYDKYIKPLQDSGIITVINSKEMTESGYPRFDLHVNNTIGPAYGAALDVPTFEFSNQVDYIINEIKNNPNSRRILTEIWIPDKLKDMALTPCVHKTTWNVINGKLYLIVTQRSCDIALGLVANVFQYSVLHKLIAKECGLEPAELIWNIDNAHIYDRHIEDLKKQIELPTLSGFKLDLSKVDSFNSWTNPDDITVPNYAEVVTNKIKYEVAI